MAISSMQKVMIVAHRSQASDLLGVLQGAGIVQILDAERAMVSKEWPELRVEKERHREIDESIDRLGRGINFVKPYSAQDPTSLFAPLINIDAQAYHRIVSEKNPLTLLSQTESVSGQMEKLAAETGSQQSLLSKLAPWQSLTMPIEELSGLSTSTVFVGLIPDQHIQDVREKLAAMGAVYEKVASFSRREACIVVALNETAAEVLKTLRAVDFEAAVFEGLTGTVREAVTRIQMRLGEIQEKQDELGQQAAELAKNKLNLQVLFDHYQNMQGRVHTESAAPATDHVVFFEGWVKQHDYKRLEKLVAPFDACAVSPITPGENEEPPVEIDNPAAVRPFETVTRLYGMPIPSSIDPTLFLAPFFAIFFGLCMADVGYGLILIAILAWILKKAQGDKKIFWMLLVCGVTTVIAGAITGSWFGDATSALIPPGSGLYRFIEGDPETQQLGFRQRMMLFDPMKQPMTFFLLSLGLGYFQIQCGLLIACIANLIKKDWAAAVCEQLVWLVHLNCLLGLGLAKGGLLPSVFARPFGITAIVTSLVILLFTVRSGAWGGRLGLGFYQLFSTVFYMGDVLSYSRLMALGMVGSGFGMAINVLVKLAAEAPYVGWLLGAVIFVGGHLFNVGLSILGAFVHTMRLQFVEFFPKFFTGGGRQFKPLSNEFKYVSVKE